MFVQLVHIRVKPGCVDRFLEVFRVNFEGTRAEPGNYRFDVLQDPEDDHHFVIYEGFVNEAAVDEHRKTAHYAEVVKGLAEIQIGGREKQFFRMVMPDHAAALAGE
ncbi:antibiotic biosynthesis monooxygenase [Rhodobacter sp. TJ_12]|uniref:antibiotic biosynthesis monooxygenase n=1 Tax=Rhodobacter sp. TJ_12 TaxID=2029399 RepID=UPI001CBE869F|nr:antibiotic biosynthesis monooxygenase [Rhodobacter sp. TJ_12]MBZ4023482.1 antibiotic biosynthesis monooxygenase [Rhodobacter sp. TJ_12]